MVKLKDLPIKKKITDKHKFTLKILYFMTWILFLPIIILQLIGELFDCISSECACLRTKMVYTIFKIIYKKEIITHENDLIQAELVERK